MIRDGQFRKAESSERTGCVEVAAMPQGGVRIRDSKHRAGPVLACSDEEWRLFITNAKRGVFALPR
jgi:hypothetical protein